MNYTPTPTQYIGNETTARPGHYKACSTYCELTHPELNHPDRKE